MKKLVLLPISLSLFVLTMFFSCTKDAQVPSINDSDSNPIVSMTMGEDGIMNVKFTEQSSTGQVDDRDGECTMYEAIRFTEKDGTTNYPIPDQRIRVDVKFRLVKINKSTHAITALTSFTTVSNVGGLNISWYNYSPLSDSWYATQYEYCYRTGTLGGDPFAVSDFWSDDYLVQVNPWCCNNLDTADFLVGPFYPTGNNLTIIVVANLEEECKVTGELTDPCYFFDDQDWCD